MGGVEVAAGLAGYQEIFHRSRLAIVAAKLQINERRARKRKQRFHFRAMPSARNLSKVTNKRVQSKKKKTKISFSCYAECA
jgi:hypothetical protein